MSTTIPPKGHRHTKSAAIPATAASLQNPQNPHHLNNVLAYTQNSQADMRPNQSVQVSQPTTPPRTPRRDIQHQNASNSTGTGTGSKQKNRNKNRPKNVMTSPAVTKNDHNTPPLTGAQSAGVPTSTKPMNTPSAAAYAGPTFHASPAPSALPIPSFYSKSVPDSPGMKGLKALKETPLSTPPRASSILQSQREESPLDLIFKADREEKARAKSASSTQATASATGPFPPPASPRNSQTPPAVSGRDGYNNRMPASGIFAMELDGDRESGTQFGPAFSTPYSERIKAVRSTNQAIPVTTPSKDVQSSSERAEALKAYLFSNHTTSSTQPSDFSQLFSPGTQPPSGPRSAGLPQRPLNNNFSPSRQDAKSTTIGHRASGRASGLRQEVTPSKTPTRTPDRPNYSPNFANQTQTYGNTSNSSEFSGQFTSHRASPIPPIHGVSSDNRSTDLRGMEDSLRKILKLGPAGSSGGSQPGVGSLPAATASVPNYVGGRPPPMNGIHNGFMGS